MTLQFLPWARRGLAAELTHIDNGGALPARAAFPVNVTVNSAVASTDIKTYGPGDVTGLDMASISRTTPDRYATNVAPDEFVAVEFDEPDLPWLFTPAAPNAQNRLRPWLVLVVIAKGDGVAVTVDRTRPLPTLAIESPAVPAEELPDLSQSWAWAHTQLMTADAATDAAVAINGAAHQNLSRIFCPRRLKSDTPYLAALVPAFDLGVDAGKGNKPDGDQVSAAWDVDSLGDEITLPVYYHWEFKTGPAGDFESLVRKLQPKALPNSVGGAPMFIGDAHPSLPQLDSTKGGIIDMEGALRAPLTGAGAELDERHEEFVAELTTLVNDASQSQTDGYAAGQAESVAPPIYGQWQSDTHQIPLGRVQPRWLADLNTDPRHRSAAGLGAEVVRANQEEYVDTAWSQVGDIQSANDLLELNRAMARVLDRLWWKNIVEMDPLWLLAHSAKAHQRMRMQEFSVFDVLNSSPVLPGFTSRTFRRMASPRSSMLRGAERRRGIGASDGANLGAGGLDGAIDGSLDTIIAATPDGVIGADVLDAVGAMDLPAAASAMIDILSQTVEIRANSLQTGGLPAVSVRNDLAEVGLYTDRNVNEMRSEGMFANGLPQLLDELALPGGNIGSGSGSSIGGSTFGGPPGSAVSPDGFKPTPTVDSKALNGFAESVTARLDAATELEALLPKSPAPTPLDTNSIRDSIVELMRPRPMLEERVKTRIQASGRPLGDGLSNPVSLHQKYLLSPMFVGPVMDRPLYFDLAKYDQNRFLPGAGNIADNAITLVETNPRFIEAFMVGANHEFNRELLWRRFPASYRGTPFKKFWDRVDGANDIVGINDWSPSGRLSTQSIGDSDGSLVLLVRGQLLRRFPNTVIYATPANADRQIDLAAELRLPVFAGSLQPDLAFVGFDFNIDEANAGDGMMFVLQEQPTEPRFGLDIAVGTVAQEAPDAWSDLTWDHVGAEPGQFLDVEAFTGNPSRPLAADQPAVTAAFGVDSGQLAAITFQRPFRAAIHVSEVVN